MAASTTAPNHPPLAFPTLTLLSPRPGVDGALLRLLKEPAENSIVVDLHHAIGMENQPVPHINPARSTSGCTNGQRLANVVATVVETLLLPSAHTATTKMVIPPITHAQEPTHSSWFVISYHLQRISNRAITVDSPLTRNTTGSPTHPIITARIGMLSPAVIMPIPGIRHRRTPDELHAPTTTDTLTTQSTPRYSHFKSPDRRKATRTISAS